MTKAKKHSPKRKAPGPGKKPAAKKARGKPEENRDKSAQRVENLEAKVKELNEKLLRAMAEVENTRRRAEREGQDARAYAITGFARDLLNVSDNFQRALSALSKEVRENGEFKPFVEGVEMTARELMNIFERHGIKKINPKGQEFDHNLHQAMFEVETNEHPPGTVMEVIQEGYVIRDRLLRPAMVGVAKKPKDEKAKPEEPEKNKSK